MGKHKSSKKHKKEKKRSKRQDYSSSSEDEWVEAESVHKYQKTHVNKRPSKKKHSSSSESSPEELIRRRKSTKNREYSVSSNESEGTEKREKRGRSTSNSSSDNEVGEEGILKHTDPTSAKRDDWMNLSTSFSSFSNVDRRKQKEQEKSLQKQSEQYNPSKCPRELNPYWKDGGDGLPKFQKPKFDSDNDDNYVHKSTNRYKKTESSWRKNKSDSSSSKDQAVDLGNPDTKQESKVSTNISFSDNPVTEKDLNLLAGKLVKAEIMGNQKLIAELTEKLKNAREALDNAKLQDNEVLLVQTDRQGRAKPLTLQSEQADSSDGRKRKKAVSTHQDNQRTKYFPDDNKYSLKQMFENEKFNTINDQDREFMRIASTSRKNDDMDDFFVDNVRRKKSDSKINEANKNKAINEHNSMSESLDNCSKCIQSNSMQKHLIISMGEYVYLSLPPHEPLTEGHCFIVPIRHVCSATQLDENEWSEILDVRKALVRLAQSKNEDPIFFEIATGFHKYPHMIIECIPLPKKEGDMAPIYFKKAIDESETEWAQNKKLVSLKGRDVRRAIPKELPYFSVSFGMEEGFAHVIEDEKMFPKNFAQEIIGGMLDLHHSKWRKPGRQSFKDQSKRVLEFSNQWKDFDCTNKN